MGLSGTNLTNYNHLIAKARNGNYPTFSQASKGGITRKYYLISITGCDYAVEIVNASTAAQNPKIMAFNRNNNANPLTSYTQWYHVLAQQNSAIAANVAVDTEGVYTHTAQPHTYHSAGPAAVGYIMPVAAVETAETKQTRINANAHFYFTQHTAFIANGSLPNLSADYDAPRDFTQPDYMARVVYPTRDRAPAKFIEKVGISYQTLRQDGDEVVLSDHCGIATRNVFSWNLMDNPAASEGTIAKQKALILEQLNAGAEVAFLQEAVNGFGNVGNNDRFKTYTQTDECFLGQNLSMCYDSSQLTHYGYNHTHPTAPQNTHICFVRNQLSGFGKSATDSKSKPACQVEMFGRVGVNPEQIVCNINVHIPYGANQYLLAAKIIAVKKYMGTQRIDIKIGGDFNQSVSNLSAAIQELRSRNFSRVPPHYRGYIGSILPQNQGALTPIYSVCSSRPTNIASGQSGISKFSSDQHGVDGILMNQLALNRLHSASIEKQRVAETTRLDSDTAGSGRKIVSASDLQIPYQESVDPNYIFSYLVQYHKTNLGEVSDVERGLTTFFSNERVAIKRYQDNGAALSVDIEVNGCSFTIELNKEGNSAIVVGGYADDGGGISHYNEDEALATLLSTTSIKKEIFTTKKQILERNIASYINGENVKIGLKDGRAIYSSTTTDATEYKFITRDADGNLAYESDIIHTDTLYSTIADETKSRQEYLVDVAMLLREIDGNVAQTEKHFFSSSIDGTLRFLQLSETSAICITPGRESIYIKKEETWGSKSDIGLLFKGSNGSVEGFYEQTRCLQQYVNSAAIIDGYNPSEDGDHNAQETLVSLQAMVYGGSTKIFQMPDDAFIQPARQDVVGDAPVIIMPQPQKAKTAEYGKRLGISVLQTVPTFTQEPGGLMKFIGDPDAVIVDPASTGRGSTTIAPSGGGCSGAIYKYLPDIKDHRPKNRLKATLNPLSEGNHARIIHCVGPNSGGKKGFEANLKIAVRAAISLWKGDDALKDKNLYLPFISGSIYLTDDFKQRNASGEIVKNANGDPIPNKEYFKAFFAAFENEGGGSEIPAFNLTAAERAKIFICPYSQQDVQTLTSALSLEVEEKTGNDANDVVVEDEEGEEEKESDSTNDSDSNDSKSDDEDEKDEKEEEEEEDRDNNSNNNDDDDDDNNNEREEGEEESGEKVTRPSTISAIDFIKFAMPQEAGGGGKDESKFAEVAENFIKRDAFANFTTLDDENEEASTSSGGSDGDSTTSSKNETRISDFHRLLMYGSLESIQIFLSAIPDGKKSAFAKAVMENLPKESSGSNISIMCVLGMNPALDTERHEDDGGGVTAIIHTLENMGIETCAATPSTSLSGPSAASISPRSEKYLDAAINVETMRQAMNTFSGEYNNGAEAEAEEINKLLSAINTFLSSGDSQDEEKQIILNALIASKSIGKNTGDEKDKNATMSDFHRLLLIGNENTIGLLQNIYDMLLSGEQKYMINADRAINIELGRGNMPAASVKITSAAEISGYSVSRKGLNFGHSNV
jgi:hypothetical protein